MSDPAADTTTYVVQCQKCQTPFDALQASWCSCLINERTFAASGIEAPPRILLFQRNLERFARDEAELRREIARTLHHELAHYLGFAEDEMVGLDLD